MKELLFEVGTEEIPARLIERARAELVQRITQALADAELAHGEPRSFGTPRRIAVVIDIEAHQPDKTEELIGPPVTIAFDGAGNPTKAALGFAKRNGVAMADIGRKATPKGDKLAVTVHTPGKLTTALLPDLLTEAVDKLSWPKPMRWGSSRQTFIRPVHWVVALYGGEVIDLELFGIRSGDSTRGHRFMAPEPFRVGNAAEWVGGLQAAKVQPDGGSRRSVIAQAAQELAASVGGVPVLPDSLLEEIGGLVEWPVPLLSSFDASFLELPQQVLVTYMQAHQKYIAIRTAEGALTNHFIITAGTESSEPAVVCAGNSRVLAARFSDARFSFDSDTRRDLESMLEALDGRTFLKGLGTMKAKALRVEQLAGKLAAALGLDADTQAQARRAGRLAKADLSSEMVGEFPDLQGQMGREYARLAGEPEAVAVAIDDHYKPRFAADELPTDAVSQCVALADRLDSIAGCFGIGLEPTGSADPYALRRQALAVVRILETLPHAPGLAGCLDLASEVYGDVLEGDWPPVRDRISAFIRGRMKAAFTKNDGFSADLVEAVLSVGYDAPSDVRGRLEALAALKETAGWDALATTVKRAANIVADGDLAALDPTALSEPAELALYAAYIEVRSVAAAALDSGDYAAALERIVTLKPAIDAFFDGVMVMSEVSAERERRLALLGAVCGSLFHRVAAFDKVST